MVLRQFRIQAARVIQLPDLLLVQLPSGPSVKVSLDQGTPRPYRGEGPVWLRIGDRTGLVPELEEELPMAPDSFGMVLTEMVFVGEATARVEDRFLVVETAGNVQLLEGASAIPFTAGDLMGASVLTWVCNDFDGSPHQPV